MSLRLYILIVDLWTDRFGNTIAADVDTYDDVFSDTYSEVF